MEVELDIYVLKEKETQKRMVVEIESWNAIFFFNNLEKLAIFKCSQTKIEIPASVYAPV